MRALQEILVEGNSEPGIIVYHASRARFDRFDDAKVKNGITAGWGHYFSESESLARRFLEDRTGYLYKVRLNITEDELAVAFNGLSNQPNALRAFQSITAGFNDKQNQRMFGGIYHGKDNASARRIHYPLENMSWTQAMARLASVLAGGRDTRDVHERKAAELVKARGIHAVIYHDLGAPSGVYNYNCFDSSRIQILERLKVQGTRSWWERDPNY